MPGNLNRPTIRVEGRDDHYALLHLLKRHGIDCDEGTRDRELPEFEEAGGIDELLDTMVDAIRYGEGQPVGFVLDADAPHTGETSNWERVRARLREVGIRPPETPPATGFRATAANYNATVGIWLMPDNSRAGELEDFLRDLVVEDDTLIDYAETATDHARELDPGRAEDGNRRKSIMHTWLAWQREPGRPYGIAMRAKYFDHNAEVAQRFVDWFKRLYGIE